MPDEINYFEDSALVDKAFCLDLLKAAPDLKSHLEDGYFNFENWSHSDGSGFMEELQRACGRLADKPEGELILPKVFEYLEAKATELELSESGIGKLSSFEKSAVRFLLFIFTDNPTGKDPIFQKLAPFMGPKITKECGLS